jgi:hypothetical protein
MTEHLRGPWSAFLADRHGFVYESMDDARENVEDPYEEVTITVVRGTAMPNDRSGCRLRLPGSHHCGDKAYELDDVYLDDPDDPSVGAEARFEQAKAMAAGLNAAGGAS